NLRRSNMMIKRFVLPALVAALAGSAFAQECSVTLDGTDAMHVDIKGITAGNSCTEFTDNLPHSGNLAKNVMGHNWVLSKGDDVRAVASDGISAGLDKSYLKPGDERVIAFTDIIGGGEKTSVPFPVAQLKDGEDYTFFCSFPGHVAIMQ